MRRRQQPRQGAGADHRYGRQWVPLALAQRIQQELQRDLLIRGVPGGINGLQQRGLEALWLEVAQP